MSVQPASASQLADDLLGVLRVASGDPGLAYDRPPEPLSGGFWAELVAFRLREPPPRWPPELVARLMPDPMLAAKETAIQGEVARQGYPTPAVRAAGGSDSGLGRAFLVMDRAEGTPLLAGLSGAAAIARLPQLTVAIPNVLADAMAGLHRLDPAPLGAIGSSGVGADVAGLLDALRARAAELRRDDLAAAARWLAEHPPPDAPSVICHGDLHPFNVLRRADGAVTVLDWTAALVGPAAYDAAFTSLLLAEPPLAAPAPLRPLVRAGGGWLSRRFLRRYRRQSGAHIDEDSLRWHRGLVCLRSLVEVASWVAADEVEARAGHPWLVCGPAFARRLSSLTDMPVAPR